MFMVITHAELYREVWEVPAVHLARMYGVSDVTLGKICRRHAIPKPWKGYWTEVEHGKKPVRPSLPHRDGVATIEIRAVVKPEAAGESHQDGLVDLIRSKKLEVSAIKNWDRAHSQTKNLRAVIQSSGEDQTGRVGDQREGFTRAVLVSRPLVVRALTFLDSLFRLLEEIGCTVTVTSQGEHPRGLVFRYKEGDVHAQLVEEVRRKDMGTAVNRWAYRLTGRLVFRFAPMSCPGTRQHWRDTRSKPLEQMLGDIAVDVLVVGRLEDEKARRQKERQQRWRHEWLQREAAERREAEEAAWQKKLQDVSEEWFRYERVRNLISACEARFVQQGLGATREEAVKWLARAKRYAEEINPLKRGFLDRFIDNPSNENFHEGDGSR